CPRMRIVRRDAVLHQHCPEPMDRHSLPGSMWWIWLSIVQGLEDEFLTPHGDFHERLFESSACHFFDGSDPEPVCLLVGRHVFIPKAIQGILVQAIIHHSKNRNGSDLRSIILWHETVENR